MHVIFYQGHRRRYHSRSVSSESRSYSSPERRRHRSSRRESDDYPSRSRSSGGRRTFDSTSSYGDRDRGKTLRRSSVGDGDGRIYRSRSTRSCSPLTPPSPRQRKGASSREFPACSTMDTVAVSKEGGLDISHREQGACGSRTQRLLCGLSLNPENVQRRERRARETAREVNKEIRESTGRKPHFVHVNADGKPYGIGVTTWNDALAKIVRGLDPSYVDIRQQPFNRMETLMNRLHDDFEYSEPLNPAWLRYRVGNALSSYRHELIRMIQAKQERPVWVSETIWSKLVRMSESESFKLKSAQMKFANSCRRNK